MKPTANYQPSCLKLHRLQTLPLSGPCILQNRTTNLPLSGLCMLCNRMACMQNPCYDATDIKWETVWANVPVLIKFLIIMCWVNWGEHGKLLHFQFLIYVALPTQTISICIRRHFLSRRECMDWTIQQFIMLGWNCLIITSILWTKYCKLYQTTNATRVCIHKMWPHTHTQPKWYRVSEKSLCTCAKG
jgi:hypothetical protein